MNSKVIDDVLAECERQDAKWGSNVSHSHERWLAIFIEEVGEVAKEILESNQELLYQELIQTVAVGLHWLEDIAYDNS